MSVKKKGIKAESGYEPAKVDPNSITTTTMLSFVVFAALLVFVMWMLTYFFVDSYYSSMRSQDAVGAANSLEIQYNTNPMGFEAFAAQTASSNSLYIRLDSNTGSVAFDGTSGIRDEKNYLNDVKLVNSKLAESKQTSVTAILKDKASESNTRLVYAKQIGAYYGAGMLYIIAPLEPDYSTLKIIRNLLLYVSVIVLIMAVVLAFFLSKRITSPIKGLTDSAKELSQGNYTAKFNGENFTETKELAKALNKASYEMEKTDFYQREIIANVSHDLKTPLTMIRSYAEKIIDISGDNPEKRNSDLNIIISETDRLNHLVQDIMTVSNLQSNKVELNKETFNFVGAAAEVFESFAVLKESEGFDIRFNPCKPCYVVGDKSKIKQVMANFMSNAVKYSGDNKYLEIQLKRSKQKVTFHCIDHGVGIASDELQHVWDRYYRTSANHEREIEGSGLGLSIVKGILNLHNAAYGVNSEIGKGSDFWFEMETVRKPVEKDGKEK